MLFFNTASTSANAGPSEGYKTPEASPSRKRKLEDFTSTPQSPDSRTKMPPHRHLVDPFFRHLATTLPSKEYLEQIESLNNYNRAIKDKITACFNNIYYVITQRSSQNQDVSIHSGLIREATYGEPIKGSWHSEKAATFFINISNCIDAINKILDDQSLPKAIEKILETTYDYLFLHLDLIKYLLSYSPTESTKNISPIVLTRIKEHQSATTILTRGLQTSPEQEELIRKIHTEAILQKTPQRISMVTKENASTLSKMNPLAREALRTRTRNLQEQLSALLIDENSDEDTADGHLSITLLNDTIEGTPQKSQKGPQFFSSDSDSEDSSEESIEAIDSNKEDNDDELMQFGGPRQPFIF